MYLSDQVKQNGILESIFDIEEVLSQIKDAEGEVEHLQSLKKWRNSKIDEKITSIEESIDTAKKIVLNTMSKLEPKKKTIPFPGVGKVTRKIKAANWQVEDSDKMLADLASKGLKDRVIEQKETVVKKSLNALLDELEKDGKDVPQGVKKTEASESLSITFEEEKFDNRASIAPSSTNLDKLDSLEL